MQKSKGFSIVEVIIAITIISVIGVFTSTLLTRTYRSTSDTELISKLKQNGEVASNNIAEAIRMADGVVCYGPQSDLIKKWIVIRTIEGKYLLFRFVDPVMTGPNVTQNGYIARQDDLRPDRLANFCITQPPDFAQNILITDNNISSGVSVGSGEFKQLQGFEGKDTVTIKFDVGPPGLPAGSSGTVNIQSTVQVR